MGFRKVWILGAALCGALLCGANSRAGTVDFLATGTFTSSGTPTSASGDSTVSYTNPGPQSATVPPATNISLGTFTVTSTALPATPDSFSDSFSLTILTLTRPSTRLRSQAR